MFKKSKITAILSCLVILMVAAMATSCGNASTATLSIQSTAPVSAPAGSLIPARISSRNAAATAPSISVIDIAGKPAGVISLTKAYLAIKEIEIEVVGEESEECEYNGTHMVDLLNNTVTPELPVITLPDGEYDEIEMDIDIITALDLDSNGNTIIAADHVMFGKSLYLEGSYTVTGGTAVPFKMAFETEEEVILKDNNSTKTFALAGHSDLIVAFRMDNWFNFSNKETNGYNVDFSALTDFDLNNDADPAVLAIKKDIMDIIQENIEDSADFGEDSDDDGELGEEEDDD